VQGNYQAANQTGLAARQQFQSLGQSAQAAAAEEYAALAARGIEAEEQVKTAGELLRRLQLRPARQLLLGAYTTFGELGDETRAAQTRDVLALIARGEQILAAACLASGGALVAWSSRRRYKERPMALPLT
jgi:transketolase N-terminal domain/subunit